MIPHKFQDIFFSDSVKNDMGILIELEDMNWI